MRHRALDLCAELGAPFSALTASWAPFLVVTASLLRAGGRMAFVVPASIGHAPYAAPLIEFLVARFDLVRIVPIRRKLFPHLSEDCWLLFADSFGGSTGAIHFAPIEHFGEFRVSGPAQVVPVDEWRRDWNRRLRPYLLNRAERSLYQDIVREQDSSRLGLAASVGIGYVTGDTMTPTRDAGDAASRFHRLHAFRHFAEFEGRTQTQAHIKPLHGYVTCRLVLEGGFHPSELTPRPPLRVETAGGRSGGG